MKLFTALLILFSSAVLAQTPPRAYFPWWESPLSRDLNLTPEQQDQIRSILKQNRAKMIDERAAVEKAEAAVEDLFNEPEVNEAQAEKAIDELVAARGEMTRTFTRMSLKLRQVLTEQQWHRLQARRSQWKSMMWKRRRPAENRWSGRPRGPASPGAPPPPRRSPEPPQPPRP